MVTLIWPKDMEMPQTEMYLSQPQRGYDSQPVVRVFVQLHVEAKLLAVESPPLAVSGVDRKPGRNLRQIKIS